MSPERWNHHVIFMDEIHKHFEEIAAHAWRLYEKHGRGTMFVSKEQWLAIVKMTWTEKDQLFPFSYYRTDEVPEQEISRRLGAGFIQMLNEYDPERQVVLTVQHHPGELLSSYLLVSEPGLREVHEARQED